jgi:hypothetical protein
MRPNYLNFLELVLRSIESEVEFDVYRSFLLRFLINFDQHHELRNMLKLTFTQMTSFDDMKL